MDRLLKHTVLSHLLSCYLLQGRMEKERRRAVVRLARGGAREARFPRNFKSRPGESFFPSSLSLSLSFFRPSSNDISIRLAVYFRSVCRHARAPTKFERGGDTIRDAVISILRIILVIYIFIFILFLFENSLEKFFQSFFRLLYISLNLSRFSNFFFHER